MPVAMVPSPGGMLQILGGMLPDPGAVARGATSASATSGWKGSCRSRAWRSHYSNDLSGRLPILTRRPWSPSSTQTTWIRPPWTARRGKPLPRAALVAAIATGFPCLPLALTRRRRITALSPTRPSSSRWRRVPSRTRSTRPSGLPPSIRTGSPKRWLRRPPKRRAGPGGPPARGGEPGDGDLLAPPRPRPARSPGSRGSASCRACDRRRRAPARGGPPHHVDVADLLGRCGRGRRRSGRRRPARRRSGSSRRRGRPASSPRVGAPPVDQRGAQGHRTLLRQSRGRRARRRGGPRPSGSQETKPCSAGRRVVVEEPGLRPGGAAVGRAGQEDAVGIGVVAGLGQPVGGQRAVRRLRHGREVGPVGEEVRRRRRRSTGADQRPPDRRAKRRA